MNTKNLKAYAPKARKQFIDAVKKRAAHFGIYEDRIEEVRIEGGAAIIEGRAFTRKEGEQRKRLERKITERGYDMFIREMAYTWFNRLAALRYMEIHDYFDHGFRVLSHPTNSDSLPEILNHASDVADNLGLDKNQIVELQLAGDKEEELYHQLLLGQCHHLYKIMPFMFEAIDDATELLLPNNLTKTDSILKGLINDIPEEDWQEIEVIGWLYQFYISEHKDAVIGKVVKSEDIPAATQLFTPNWIVKYLVHNSVGRQWLATYPDSELKGKMEYYIEPAEQSEEVIEQLKAITPTRIDPEEIKVLDPACGSGHILVEVYEVLREIYLERGYRLREIPELILTKNIYGLDIDDRAAQLAAFALMMKAREDDRRIFQRVEGGEVSLNVFSVQSSEHLDIIKLWKALDLEGNQQTGSTGGLFENSEIAIQPTGFYKEYFELLKLLKLAFIDVKTLGSLIQIEHRYLDTLIVLKKELLKRIQCTDPAAIQASLELLPIVSQAILLTSHYDCVVANPPYMGNNGMNKDLKDFGTKNYKAGKANLYSMFMMSILRQVEHGGQIGLMTPISWMSLNTFKETREFLSKNSAVTTFVQPEYNAFWDSAHVAICAFTIQKSLGDEYDGTYINLAGFYGGDIQSSKLLNAIKDKNCSYRYTACGKKFKKIPGQPIAYWVKGVENFDLEKVGDTFESGGRTKTHDNQKYLRYFWEVNQLSDKWVPFANGGDFRKYSGNESEVVDWSISAKNFYDSNGGLVNDKYDGLEGICWSLITSAITSFRIKRKDQQYSSGSPTIFNPERSCDKSLLALLNSPVAYYFLKAITPTVNTTVRDVFSLPYNQNIDRKKLAENVDLCIKISDIDQTLTETTPHFESHPLICPKKYDRSNFVCSDKVKSNNIAVGFSDYIEFADSLTNTMKNLEEANNQAIQIVYGLEDELKFEIPEKQVTIDCNRHYKYSNLDEEKAIKRFQSETIADLLSYYLGCALGRYSLDRNGVVYASHNNEDFKSLEAEGAYKAFPADDDGIIPLASEEWLFDDDATTRFKEFVKTVWGEEHLSENLEFVSESLCLNALKPKKGENAMETIRRYFSTQFFKDHCKTYKKRPIYWLFSSGKEKAFECLVYLHRYNEGTLSRMRTEYVTPLMGKYDAQHTLLSEQQLQATGTESRRIEKELKSLEKKQAELRTFDEQLKHYAEMRITLDLDDGVKANYGKFGNLLADVKAIHGKEVK